MMNHCCLAVDPGPARSAYVVLEHGGVRCWGLEPNAVVRRVIAEKTGSVDAVAIEMIASFGMAVGAEVFDTCVWIGRFAETARMANSGRDDHVEFIKRLEVKIHLCHSPKANDSNIRQALIDRFGPGKERAIGSKAEPGPLYHIKSDIWAALAVACTWWDRNKPDGYRRKGTA